MADFDKLSLMKVGDVFYECEYGTNLRARIITEPVASNDGYEGRRVLRWKAENTENGELIDYMLTENLDHYGPRIYDQPQYGFMRNGEFVFPILGAPPLSSSKRDEERNFSEQTRSQYENLEASEILNGYKTRAEAAEASLRLVTQRREDAVEALRPFAFDGLSWPHGDTVTTRIRIVDIERARLALQPKEN